ncbi:MAG: metallophosphoesterase [Saprospiraceae bacterium]|nr:metallophosphoesterase [Saprospiraceae bacterium]
MIAIKNKHIFLFLALSTLVACGTKKHPYFNATSKNWSNKPLPTSSKLVHTLYLIGDSGEMDDRERHTNFVVEAMASMVEMTNSNSSIVFLGDNIYPSGLANKQNTTMREEGIQIIKAQLAPFKDFEGKTYMIPGNHDWNHHKRGGLEAVQRQEDYVEANYGNKGGLFFYPDMGCGDPQVVHLNKEVVYIFIDSQWWMQSWDDEQNINQGCEISSRDDLMIRMKELFMQYKNKEIICMLHHPIKSNGNHGGYFSLKQHIFPLAESGIWLPLPIIGSIYPIYRRVKGNKQDNTNNHNQNLTKGLESLAKDLDIDIVFASGHEHGLEYYESSKIKYIVSGSGSKTSYIQRGGDAVYARQARGYARILFYKNFESWLEFYTIQGFNESPSLEYRVQLRVPETGTEK